MPKYPERYLEYLIHFHTDRDFFECHEVMEDHWKLDSESESTSTWLGLIQVAVSLYHQRRNNRQGAILMAEQALQHLSEDQLSKIGIAGAVFINILQQRKDTLLTDPERGYSDINIPLEDRGLLKQCERRCHELGFIWGQPSNMDQAEIVHKHLLRDRTEVVQTRLKEIERRKREKGDETNGKE